MFRIVRVSNVSKRSFSLSTANHTRKPPKEEYENSGNGTRKKTSEPFDRRWRWTAKSAEPFNIKGGHYDWTQMKITHRGVQSPGYIDPKTKRYIHVEEMVPEIIVPDLTDFKLKPYVTYSTLPPKEKVFDAKTLYKETLEKEILLKLKNKEQST